MVQEQAGARLDQFVIKNNCIFRDESLVVQLHSNIAEIARINERLFVILDVSDELTSHLEMGTNLWCVDVKGKTIWKSPNVNQGILYDTNFPLCYSDMRIFDKLDPKITCYVDERMRAVLRADTGTYAAIAGSTNWRQSYQAAWQQHLQGFEKRESEMFVESLRLCRAGPSTPFTRLTCCPPSVDIAYKF